MNKRKHSGMYLAFGKRAFDIAISTLLLVLLSPFYLLIASVLLVRQGHPVLFKQSRPGLNEKIFQLYKFRTMIDSRDPFGQLKPDEQRLTQVGRWLRTTSLDELPTLYNVLCGDMSLVGPRPLLIEYLSRYSKDQHRRHDVQPGITGWAQVNGRNALSWSEKFALDLWYVNHVSLKIDLLILAKTALEVGLRRGISAQNHATMPQFLGNDEVVPKPINQMEDR